MYIAYVIIALVIIAVIYLLYKWGSDMHGYTMPSDMDIYKSSLKIGTVGSAYDKYSVYKGTNLEKTNASGKTYENGVWGMILGAFRMGGTGATNVAAPVVGNCADLAAIANNPSLRMTYFKDGQLYNVDYKIGDALYRGQFKFSRPLGGKPCWKFMGNMSAPCGSWKYKTESCPFAPVDCDNMKSYFMTAGEGATWTDAYGRSYKYENETISCTAL